MKLVENLQNKKIYVISPHFDDAVLSCGSLLSALAGNADITVINLFTKAHSGPYTLSAQKFLRDTGNYKNAETLFEARALEDNSVLSQLGVKIVNLGLVDSLYRRKLHKSFLSKLLPEISHVYPTYRFHIVRSIAKKDPVVPLLKDNLEKFKKPDVVVLAPYGIGNHADHKIARQTSVEIFDNVILYSDFPYSVRMNDYGSEATEYKKVSIRPDLKGKNNLIKLYQTQYTALFPSGQLPEHNEVYYVNKSASDFLNLN